MIRGSSLRAWTIAVPAIVLAGIASGYLSGSGEGNGWYAALAKPGFTPPGWVFPIAWTTAYVLMGLSLGLLVEVRARVAIALFAIQLALNLAWSPIFFAGHNVTGACVVIGLLDTAVLATIAAAWHARRAAAWLLLPYAAWLGLATALTVAIRLLNPAVA